LIKTVVGGDKKQDDKQQRTGTEAENRRVNGARTDLEREGQQSRRR